MIDPFKCSVCFVEPFCLCLDYVSFFRQQEDTERFCFQRSPMFPSFMYVQPYIPYIVTDNIY
jgi:hypothetical protein